MSLLNSYLEKIATEGAAVDFLQSEATMPRGEALVKRTAPAEEQGRMRKLYEMVKRNPGKTALGVAGVAGAAYGAKKLKDRMSEKKASLDLDDAYELGFYDAIEKVAAEEAAAEAASPSSYRKAVEYIKDKAGKGYGYVKDKGSLALQYAKANPYKTGGGALALAGAAYGAKKLKDRMSEKKASLDLDDAYELGFYDAIEKVAKKEEEGRGSRYSRIGGSLALPLAGIYGGGVGLEKGVKALAERGKIDHLPNSVKNALKHSKNIGRGVGGAAGLAAAYGLNKSLEKKSAYEEATLDKVAMWMDAGY